jgi:hypothetical protein
MTASYAHTGDHIHAAPMGHFSAKNDSHFMYSHDHSYLPAHGIEQMLKNENIIMRYRRKGKNKHELFHQGMYYLHRPFDLENKSLYEFFSEFQVISNANANKNGKEIFLFLESYTFHKSDVIIERDIHCVPTFPWNWLGSSKLFTFPLTQEYSTTDLDLMEKEKYCLRLMILFLPFRNKNNLLEENSYLKAFQKAYNEKRFSAEMIAIAENIQTIHNSLNSAMVQDSLGTETVQDMRDDFEEIIENDEVCSEDWFQKIGFLLTQSSHQPHLTEETKTINTKFVGKHFHQYQFDTETNLEIEDSIDFKNVIETISQPEEHKISIPVPNFCFCSNQDVLNSLSIRQLITRNTEELLDGTTKTTKFIQANGTWQSIRAWGKHSQLDLEQQTAFEVLAATYVLSFYDDVTELTTDHHFEQNKKKLEELARKNIFERIGNSAPLTMFITGPAGAGKCKILLETLLSLSYHHTLHISNCIIQNFSKITRNTYEICTKIQP